MSSKEKSEKKPPYLERVDELEKVSIVRLKGEITREMIPVIEKRIQDNRRMGSKIEKNVIADFAKVVDVDSATVAFHIIHLEEYHQKGFEVGFINLNEEMKGLLEMFKKTAPFKVYPSEDEAVRDLNR